MNAKMKNQIFEVDIKGLKQLQEGKPKWVIVRELLQNAMDEEITECIITMAYMRGKLRLEVEDDSPTGFRDLADMYTLFKDTYKRSDVKKRGRFNFGEKQVLCLADYAVVLTTTGGYQFDMLTGIKTPLKHATRQKGSSVYIEAKMTREEYDGCLFYCKSILVPPKIKFRLFEKSVKNEIVLEYRAPYSVFFADLPTILKGDGKLQKVSLRTDVHLHRPEEKAFLYELGIPICEIDCDYSLDVQQKVPLSTDRDTVDAKYLKLLYGEVLNYTIKELNSARSSNLWVREGFTSSRAKSEVRQQVLVKRFGEKALVANPMDKRSMDEAISNNYNVVYGSEMSKEEWTVIRQDGLMESTSAKFKVQLVNGQKVNPTGAQSRIGNFCKSVAKDVLNVLIEVQFYNAPEATVLADYRIDSHILRFNVARIPDVYWTIENNYLSNTDMLDLIIHELAHSKGLHYEHSYHECLTKLGSALTITALKAPEWFKI